jgi:hypothetical protein
MKPGPALPHGSPRPTRFSIDDRPVMSHNITNEKSGGDAGSCFLNNNHRRAILGLMLHCLERLVRVLE